MSASLLVLCLMAAVAGAADPPATEVEGSEGEGTEVEATEAEGTEAQTPEGVFVPEEVIVWGEELVKRRRAEVIDDAEEAGYTRKVHKDDRLVLQHEMPWKGQLELFHDGRVELRRQPLRFEPPFAKKTPLTWMSCIIVPLCVRVGGQTVSATRFRGYERRALAAVEPETMAWNEAISDLAIDRKVNNLPDALEALWTTGRDLTSDAILDDMGDRRASLFAFWDSRTENEWGNRVRRAVEAFIRAEVQSSTDPFSPAELDAFNARRASQQEFTLEKKPDPAGALAFPAGD